MRKVHGTPFRLTGTVSSCREWSPAAAELRARMDVGLGSWGTGFRPGDRPEHEVPAEEEARSSVSGLLGSWTGRGEGDRRRIRTRRPATLRAGGLRGRWKVVGDEEETEEDEVFKGTGLSEADTWAVLTLDSSRCACCSGDRGCPGAQSGAASLLSFLVQGRETCCGKGQQYQGTGGVGKVDQRRCQGSYGRNGQR